MISAVTLRSVSVSSRIKYILIKFCLDDYFFMLKVVEQATT